MTSILFVCHGNICRSPMAEFVMKHIACENGKETNYHIESCAATTDEIGNDMYPPVKKLLSQKEISFSPRSARLFTEKDYEIFDYIVGMDEENKYDLMRLTKGDPKGKVSLLLSWCGEKGEVADPWYTGDFETTYGDVRRGCLSLFHHIEEKE